MNADPTEADPESPEFKAVWDAIKRWDIERVPGDGLAHATGTDVMTILNALAQVQQGGIVSVQPLKPLIVAEDFG